MMYGPESICRCHLLCSVTHSLVKADTGFINTGFAQSFMIS
jgi:hypothetical protein